MKRQYEQLVRGSDFFAGLPPGPMEKVCAAYAVGTAADGGVFFRQEDPAEKAWLLVLGKVKMAQLTEDGQQVTLRIIVAGQMFGGMAALGPGGVYPASAQALEDSIALSWNGRMLRELARTVPALGMKISELMYGHVQEMQTRVRELATEKVERRIARALLRLASQAGRKEKEGILIDLPLSRQEIAELTGTTLYTVSRVLSEWERRGMIRTGRERVLIRDAHALVVVAEDIPPAEKT
ncbi:MAG: Crp/Fnr family transcriptional regulator [Spirochaetia bacterium]|jgi:CRP-like cAMP-binding protein